MLMAGSKTQINSATKRRAVPHKSGAASLLSFLNTPSFI
jgi:hypothetical protein